MKAVGGRYYIFAPGTGAGQFECRFHRFGAALAEGGVTQVPRRAFGQDISQPQRFDRQRRLDQAGQFTVSRLHKGIPYKIRIIAKWNRTILSNKIQITGPAIILQITAFPLGIGLVKLKGSQYISQGGVKQIISLNDHQAPPLCTDLCN
ncbi:hypothetical protein SDC9_212165 [bioreactor metagenome]|uniref:Uncharacterized protein n=1 Tax=bioreactor metagenome TaxID=1076179 RepID=A0A645JZG4_9ZZZZ